VEVTELNEEVEGEENHAENEKKCAPGEAATGEAAYGMKKSSGDDAEARFGARQIERPDGFKAGEIAAEGGEFVFNPNGKFLAMAPQVNGAKEEKTITYASE
jgi:hypothetical protein